jgi:hypothetical protein
MDKTLPLESVLTMAIGRTLAAQGEVVMIILKVRVWEAGAMVLISSLEDADQIYLVTFVLESANLL